MGAGRPAHPAAARLRRDAPVDAWQRRRPGAVNDAIAGGFLPLVTNSPSKRLMLTLLKQARAYGLGLVLATQNPVDLDYEALSNCGTWLLGRLQTERDVDRVIDGLQGAAQASGRALDERALRAQLAGLRSRVFLMNNVHDTHPILFRTRRPVERRRTEPWRDLGGR